MFCLTGRGGLDLSEEAVVFIPLQCLRHLVSSAYINALENCKQLGKSFMNRTKIVGLEYFFEEPQIILVEALRNCC